MFNEFAAGKKLYGGRYSPTRGRVNPKGYLKRELRKRMKAGPHGGVSKIGKDGRSDTRSGQAKAMLNRTQARPVVGAGAAKGKAKTDIFGSLGNFQPIKINNNGQLDLPYDMQASAQMLAKKESMNRDLLGLQAEDQNYILELAKLRRDAQIGYTGAQRNTLNDSAARGTAFSSQYGTGVANNASSFNNFMGDLATQEGAWKSQLSGARTGIQNAFNDYLRKAALDQQIKLAADAGKLGLGKNRNNKNPKNKSKRVFNLDKYLSQISGPR